MSKLGFETQISSFAHWRSTIEPLETHIPTQKQTSLPFIFQPRLSECNTSIHNSKWEQSIKWVFWLDLLYILTRHIYQLRNQPLSHSYFKTRLPECNTSIHNSKWVQHNKWHINQLRNKPLSHSYFTPRLSECNTSIHNSKW